MPQPRLAAALLAVCATSSALVAATAPSADAAPASFYTAPASVPTQPGTLIKSAPTFGGLNVWGTPTTIMYSSRDDNNQPVAVTGTYIEPWGKWSGPGSRPLVTYAVGTIGQGDQCAPSKMIASSLNLSTFGSLGVNYEITGINDLLAKGVGVVVTDYVGLGLPDRPHTYMNRNDQAHAVLDAARAAMKVPGATVKADSKIATYGYSQGGGAAAAADEEAATYAPELKLAASYVGAPPADLEKVLGGIDGSPIAGVAGYFINGEASEQPTVAAFEQNSLNDAGRAMLGKTSTQCAPDTVFTYGGVQTSSWTKTGQSIADVLATDPAVMSVVRAQKLGNVAPKFPVRVATSINDDIVPHAQARQLALDWCAKGGDVTYAPLNYASLGSKSILNHAAPLIGDQLTARDWVVARLMGQATSNNCASAASLK